MAVRLSVLCIGHPSSPRKIPGTPGAIVQLEGLGQLKKSNDLHGNWWCDLLAYSIVPQPTMLTCAPNQEAETQQMSWDCARISELVTCIRFNTAISYWHNRECIYITKTKKKNILNSGVQHPVARVSIRFINVTTVRNYFYFSLALFS
jgi:hypothetical protein